MYPEHGDPKFREKLMELEEYRMFQVPPMGTVQTMAEYESRVAQFCTGFEKTLYQHLMQHYLSYRSPYNGLLLYHGLGVGKTCSSITIAESMLADHSSREPPRVWVILPSTLQDSYQDQLFSATSLMNVDKMMEQCTQDTYDRLASNAKDIDAKRKRIEALIKSRYKMMTYEGFANEVDKLKEKGKLETLTNKVIIVDEAHNLRIEETDKRAATALMEVATKCQNNKLVLLSATPMYNEPDEIFWLLSLLMANDKREVPKFGGLFKQNGEPSIKEMSRLRELASEYISYIRGVNPFTFATRLSPSVHNEKMIREEWCVPITDGLVSTPLGKLQLEALDTLAKSDAIRHQGNNVCFPSAGGKFRVGKKGFDSIFGRDKDDEPYKYKTGVPHVLMPTEDMLGKYGAKLKHITDCIRQANGIVVVYSQFVWGGIVPLAIALEHMGFMRYGTKNLSGDTEIVKPRATYPGIPFPTYCIFSGDAQVMGSTSIDELVQDVNNIANKRGERIKVVLMSPIAGEGLSLKNVREIHVMDPWYHLNRINQVVGRAIRTCSHVALPVQERNVVVYLHAATADGKETMDIHSYKIAARKSAQTLMAEAEIRDNALDCALVKNVHYYPKDLFSFDILYHTSRGREVPYHFGDELNAEPQCKLPDVEDSTTMRTEVIAELVPTGLQRLRQYLRPLKDTRVRYQANELLQALRYPAKISNVILKKAACVPDALFRGYTLERHREGYVMRTPAPIAKPIKLRVNSKGVAPSTIVKGTESPSMVQVRSYEKLLESIPVTNPHEATLRIYQSLDSDIWPKFARRVIGYGTDIPMGIKPHVNILINEGAFVVGAQGTVTGFFDIFDTSTNKITLWDNERKTIRDATQKEATTIINNRKLVAKPTESSALFGFLEPHQPKSLANKHFVFKLYVPGPSVGTKTGMVCSTSKKPTIIESLKALGKEFTSAEESDKKSFTKDALCTLLSYMLKEQKRLYLPPYYKP